MNTENDNLGNLFREAFQNFEKQPSDGLWAKIEAGASTPAPPKTGFPSKAWYFAAGGATFIAITAILLYTVLSPVPQNSSSKADNDLKSKVAAAPLAESAENANPKIDNSLTAAQKNPSHPSQSVTQPTTTTSASPVKQNLNADITPDNDPQTITVLTKKDLTNHAVAVSPKPEIQRIREQTYQQEIVKDNPLPVEKVVLPTDKVICHGEKVLLQAKGGKSYLWNTGEMSDNIYVTPPQTTFYTLTLTREDNTEVVHHVKIEVKECATLYIPDAFSPNSDGRNDEFITFGTNITRFSIRIFSANGQLMFETNDINHGWDGRYKGGDATGDVYFYVVNFTDSNGQSFVRQGRLFLLR